MFLVTPHTVGDVAFARMTRDAVLVGGGAWSPFVGHALPHDQVAEASLRTLMVAACQPHGALTGLASLWVRGLHPHEPLGNLHVVVYRGSHLRAAAAPQGYIAYHSHSAAMRAAEPWGPLTLTSVPHALADALRFEALDQAMPTAYACLRRGHVSVSALRAAVGSHTAHLEGLERLRSAADAVIVAARRPRRR